MVKNRNNPHDSPITMFSVSDCPADTAWMRQLDEAAPFCDEKSLYVNEVGEVETNQGEGFPYTHGFHLVCCLVGANNPFDLDVGYVCVVINAILQSSCRLLTKLCPL